MRDWRVGFCVGLVCVATSGIVACHPATVSRRAAGGQLDRQAAPAHRPSGREAQASRAAQAFSPLPRLPLAFEANQGQVHESVKFVTRGAGYQLFLTADGATWALQGSPGPGLAAGRRTAPDLRAAPDSGDADATDSDVLRMRLIGGNRAARVTGSDEQAGKANYFSGSNRRDWHTNVPMFARVHYSQVYPGVDLVYRSRHGELEYDFVVAPGRDPGVIALGFDGARSVSVDAGGDLVLETRTGRVTQKQPVVYQMVAGVRRTVETRYVLTASNRVGFDVGAYDTSQPLVIDPVLTYSTFFGGTGGQYGEQAYGVTTDGVDNVYFAGTTSSTVFPAEGGQPVNKDAFVVKITPSGALGYVTVIKGNSGESGEGITVDAAGQVIVTGFTDSTNFPTVNPVQLNQAGRDAYALKLDASGALVYSTYLGGGSSFDYGEAAALDPQGNAYIAGVTKSADFPVLNAYQPVIKGQDAFVVKLSPAGALLYGSFLGGTGSEAGESIAVAADGSFYVTGWTASSNFPRVQSTQAKQAGDEVFVSYFAPDGQSLIYSRYLGGNAADRAYAIAEDGEGGVFVGGFTDSTNFPAALPLQGDQGGTDVFVTRLGAGGLVSFSTYVGGSDRDRVLGLAVRDGRLFVTGQTSSSDVPTVNAVQPAKAGDATSPDAFLLTMDVASSTLLSLTYLGGTGIDEGRGVAALTGGNVVVVGWTESDDFPMVRAIQDVKSNIGNVFIARVAPLGVDSVAPDYVQTAGGDAITITGQEFIAGASVRIGGAEATGVTVVNATTITATSPAVAAGQADLTVTNPDGGSATLYGALTVLNGTGPIADAGPDQSVEATSASGTQVVLDGSASFDPNHEPLTYQWRDAANNLLATGALATVVLPMGDHTITLIVSDGHSSPGTDTVAIHIVDTIAPAVAVISPNGGNKIYTGTANIIEWAASDSGSAIASFDVYLSTDGGTSYGSTPICAGVSGTLRSCTWGAPGPTGSKARVKVTARDAASNVASDASNANFTILSGTASVKVTTPTTAVNWGAGSTQQIKWNHNLGTAAVMRLDASVDGGATWAPIGAIQNNAGSTGLFNWTLPATLTTTARVRVSWANGPASDQSDVNFTIAAPFLQTAAPSAGTNWGYGTKRQQTWTTNLGPFDQVDVVLSTDGGATFPVVLATGIAASTKSATFDVPALGAPTAAARVSVVWTNAPSGFSAAGTNPGNFRVEPPFVTVTAPDGGDVWTVGSKKAITWTHNLGTLENVRIELSQDDGASYPIVVLASTPSDGTQSVVMSSSWVTTLGRMRITWLRSAAVTDASNASFEIR